VDCEKVAFRIYGENLAQYRAASLGAENRRLAAPAGLDGGVTCGLQEDMLCHPTPAALRQALRERISPYADDRPLSDDIAAAAAFIDTNSLGAIAGA
jgi:histidine ammonia-lyase